MIAFLIAIILSGETKAGQQGEGMQKLGERVICRHTCPSKVCSWDSGWEKWRKQFVHVGDISYFCWLVLPGLMHLNSYVMESQ